MWSKHNTKSKINTKPTPSRKPQIKNSNNTNIQYIGCGTATIFDLQPKDKAKIGNLIRKVVELDTECKSTQQKAKKNQTKLKKQVTALKSQNNEIIKQHTKLRSKFQKSLKLLQEYQIKLNQMDTLQSEQMKTLKNKSISNIEQEQYTKQIQEEINDLKELILDLHNKEEIKLKKLEKQKEDKQHKQHLRASRHSMIYVANNSIINDKDPILSDNDGEIDDDEIDELHNISPIQTPKSHHHPPSPHPYPINTKTKNKMSLSELRKYRISSTNSSSSPSLNKTNNHKSNKKYSMTLHKDRLNQLLRIQSGNFKKDRKNDNIHSSSFSHLVNNKNDRELRRVQSEKAVEINNNSFIDSGDDEMDRLSNYESLNLGISFPETDDDLSDQEDELLLIQHLNVIPQ